MMILSGFNFYQNRPIGLLASWGRVLTSWPTQIAGMGDYNSQKKFI